MLEREEELRAKKRPIVAIRPAISVDRKKKGALFGKKKKPEEVQQSSTATDNGGGDERNLHRSVVPYQRFVTTLFPISHVRLFGSKNLSLPVDTREREQIISVRKSEV